MSELAPVDGYLGRYAVSSDGRVFGPRGELSPQATDHGYMRVFLGHGRARKVHRLVAIAFLTNPCGYPEVNHKDGDKTNNSASNLEWSSRLGNMRHAYRAGLVNNPSGEEARRAILSQDQVDYIRSVHVPRHPEFGQSALGRKFGVTNSCVHRVVHGLNWG